METWDAIRARRNVRSFTERPISSVDPDRILEAARRTPSSSNGQRWDFVVVTDRKQLEGLATVWRGAKHIATSATTIALVGPKSEDVRTRESINYDLGQATMSIMIAAADLGIGSAHASAVDQQIAQRVLGYPSDRFCSWLIALGYPEDGSLKPLRRINRRPFQEVIHRGKW